MVQIVQCNFEELTNIVRNCLKEAINEIRTLPTPEEVSDRCTLPEACEITGLSRSKLYKLSMDDEIPFMKYGNRNIYSRKSLQRWVDERTKPAPSPESVMTDRLQQSAKRKV